MDIRGIYLYLTGKQPKFWGEYPTEKVYLVLDGNERLSFENNFLRGIYLFENNQKEQSVPYLKACLFGDSNTKALSSLLLTRILTEPEKYYLISMEMGFPMAYLEYARFVAQFNRTDEKIIYFLNAYDKGERKIASGILAKLYFVLRQYDQVICFAEEAISLGDISLNVILGHLYKENGDLITAEKYFLKYPSKSLFDFYVDQKRFHDAIRYFDKDNQNYRELVQLCMKCYCKEICITRLVWLDEDLNLNVVKQMKEYAKACIYVLCIRKYRQSRLNILPYDLIKIVVKHMWNKRLNLFYLSSHFPHFEERRYG